MDCVACGAACAPGAAVCPGCGAAAGRTAAAQVNPYAAPTAAVHALPPGERPVASPPRPWVRYGARVLDIYLLAMLAGVAVGGLFPDLLERRGADQLFSIALVFAWIFVEAALLAGVGTTPGKWLLRVRLSSATGERMTPRAALARSLRVWWRGLGAGIPLVALFTQITAYNVLQRNGVTSWDRDGGIVVVHGRVGAWRMATAVVVIVAMLALSVLGTLDTA